MAKASKKTMETDISLVSQDPNVKKPRLNKLIIKNFRCIGSKPVEIDLNEIVVLVGPNNAGKSSILKAYSVAMSEGSDGANLTIDDFPEKKIDPNNLPQIELHTVLYENTPGERWITTLSSGEMLIKEKWTWTGEGKPKRQGWDVEAGQWSDQRPWGAPNIANTGRPEPHLISAFDSPEAQADAIKTLLLKALDDKLKSLKAEKSEEMTKYQSLLSQVQELQSHIVNETQEQIDNTNKELSSLISKVFPDYVVDFTAKAVDNLDKAITFSKAESQLLMGPKDGFLSTVERQGSGARRTLLWAALKFISENNRKMKDDQISRPHLLLMDEPEICLHPNAIREACNTLYELPSTGNWQVMVTTHSPIFVDVSRDNTTIVKVERNNDGEIIGTTVFRPDKTKLDGDDKKNLKLLNLCDPYVSEFFFGGKVIIVEGDTEYTAFNYIKAQKPTEYKDIHIIRARGKATIVSLCKILNHFGSDYAVLHDSDTPKTKKGDKASPAWGNNPNILAAVKAKPDGRRIKLLASLPSFEQAYFGEEVSEDKPYNALATISNDEEKFKIVESLFQALINHDLPVPTNCIEWTSIEELKEKVEEIL
jgi:putative ATP-dependent endonuclease of OLD family